MAVSMVTPLLLFLIPSEERSRTSFHTRTRRYNQSTFADFSLSLSLALDLSFYLNVYLYIAISVILSLSVSPALCVSLPLSVVFSISTSLGSDNVHGIGCLDTRRVNTDHNNLRKLC